MDQEASKKKGFSRRTFLKGIPLGILGAAAMSIVGSKMISSASKRKLPASKKGSMFSPRDA